MTIRAVWFRWLIVVFAIGCFVIALFPQSSEWVDPAAGEPVSEFRVGVWFSPLYYRARREFARGGLKSYRDSLNWLSLSSLLIVIGVTSVAIGVTGECPPRIGGAKT
jgi:hypothetical protein